MKTKKCLALMRFVVLVVALSVFSSAVVADTGRYEAASEWQYNVVPQIEVFEVTRQEESVLVKWNVVADVAHLFVLTETTFIPDDIKFGSTAELITELGEEMPLDYEIELTLHENAVIYLLAKNEHGECLESKIVEVVTEIEPERETYIWNEDIIYNDRMIYRENNLGIEPELLDVIAQPDSPEDELFADENRLYCGNGDNEKDKKLPKIAYSLNRLSIFDICNNSNIFDRLNDALTPKAQIIINKAQRIIFNDETFDLKWGIASANSYQRSFTYQNIKLVPSKNSYPVNFKMFSGVKIGGGSSLKGTTPSISIAPKTSATKNETVSCRVTKGSGEEEIYAFSSTLSAMSKDKVDIISIPKFKGNGANTARKTAIRAACRDIYKQLKSGRILNDIYLDSKIDPFKKGYINRQDLWQWLLLSFQNLDLVTFNCTEVYSDSALKYIGQWSGKNPNTVNLCWSPSKTPNLKYVILHEFMHKCGFNTYLLLKGYSGKQIENLAHELAEVIYP